MNIKNLMAFREYYKRYLYHQNPDYVFYMFLTAKTYSEWVKVYRHFYWMVLSRDYHDLEEVKECRIFSLRMMLALSDSKMDVLAEIMHYDDSLRIEDEEPLRPDLIDEIMQKVSLKHF